MIEKRPATALGDTPIDAVLPEWAPTVDARVTSTATWIFVVADVFFFAAFFFAFFYLRAMNNNYSWLPAGTTHPTRGFGALIVALAIVTSLLYYAAMRNVATARRWLWLALVAGILAIGVQIYEFRNLGFDPQQGGGYPSVFVGLKGSLMVQFAGALLWTLTHLVQARPAGDLVLRAATAASFANFLFFLAAVNLIAYLVLYFV
jgi:heme/copper-type cytochrome/quinol oxidase subunit 3